MIWMRVLTKSNCALLSAQPCHVSLFFPPLFDIVKSLCTGLPWRRVWLKASGGLDVVLQQGSTYVEVQQVYQGCAALPQVTRCPQWVVIDDMFISADNVPPCSCMFMLRMTFLRSLPR